MYSRTILLAAASLAVAGMMETANALPAPDLPLAAREQVIATLHIHHYRLLSDPYLFRSRYVVRGVNPFGRVVLVEIDPRTGAFISEVLM
ncbi:MAG TPA: hypothetical protein VKB67_13190 [Rhizomicrobium sp.]|nr:hypothetical protein [Rhizomicrobium sp.]